MFGNSTVPGYRFVNDPFSAATVQKAFPAALKGQFPKEPAAVVGLELQAIAVN
jgi:hypothetical protein